MAADLGRGNAVDPVLVVKVRSPDQRRGVADAQLRTGAVPQPVPDRVGAVERVLRDGHACDEEGERGGGARY